MSKPSAWLKQTTEFNLEEIDMESEKLGQIASRIMTGTSTSEDAGYLYNEMVLAKKELLDSKDFNLILVTEILSKSRVTKPYMEVKYTKYDVPVKDAAPVATVTTTTDEGVRSDESH